MECWYYQIAFEGGDERIVGLEPANSTTGSYQINVSGGGNGAYSASVGDGTIYLSCVEVQPISPLDWTHLAITYDGSTFRFFINGELIYLEDGFVSPFGPPDQDLVINRHTWNGGNSWSSRLTGHLDELRISSIARYTSPFTPPCIPFVADEYTMGLWHFNEGSGSTIYDASSYGNDGIVVGAGWCDEVPCQLTEITIPRTARIDRCYPNPFNPSTTVEFSLTEPCNVVLAVYNMNGALVDLLLESFLPIGQHVVSWKPDQVASGIYTVNLQAGNQHDLSRLCFIK